MQFAASVITVKGAGFWKLCIALVFECSFYIEISAEMQPEINNKRRRCAG
jgi:hypothetical protein